MAARAGVRGRAWGGAVHPAAMAACGGERGRDRGVRRPALLQAPGRVVPARGGRSAGWGKLGVAHFATHWDPGLRLAVASSVRMV